MEKPVGLQQQVALKCPRCDSSNTKFCYYNNYSLSQPRHFCKACKRYWTRGGTLRNVPVGGGYRKNKLQRLKRPSSSTTTIDSTAATASSPSQPQPHQIYATASTSNHYHHHQVTPLFYGIASNPSCDVNLPFSSRFSSSRIIPNSSDLIHHPQMNGIGLGFSSGVMSSDDEFRNGFTSSNNSNSTLFPRYSSIFSSFSTSTTTPVMLPNNNSLLGSTLMMMMQQQKLMNSGVKADGPVGGNNITFHEGLVVAPQIEHVQMAISGDHDDDHSGSDVGNVVAASKDVKVELRQKRLLELWNINNNNNNGASASTTAANCQNQIEHHVMSLSSDPNSLLLEFNSNSSSFG